MTERRGRNPLLATGEYIGRGMLATPGMVSGALGGIVGGLTSPPTETYSHPDQLQPDVDWGPTIQGAMQGFTAMPGGAFALRQMELGDQAIEEAGVPPELAMTADMLTPMPPLASMGKTAGLVLPFMRDIGRVGDWLEVPEQIVRSPHRRLPDKTRRFVDLPHGGTTFSTTGRESGKFGTFTLGRTTPDHPLGAGHVDITAAFKSAGADDVSLIDDAVIMAVRDADLAGGARVTLDAFDDPGPAAYYRSLGFEPKAKFDYDPAQDTAQAFVEERPGYQFMELSDEAMEHYRQLGEFQRDHFARTGRNPSRAQMRDAKETIQRSIAEPGGTSSSTPVDRHAVRDPGGALADTTDAPIGGLGARELKAMPVDKHAPVWGGLAAGDDALVTPGTRPPREQRGLARETPTPTQSSVERYEEMYSPANVEHVEQGMRVGTELGAQDWYNLGNVYQSALDVLGPTKGKEKFERFAQLLAATSPRSAVRQNIRRASLGHVQAERGLPFPSGRKDLLAEAGLGDLGIPDTYGHLARNIQAPNIERAMAGVPFDPRAQPKIASFAENLSGNWQPMTVDTHFGKQVGFLDAAEGGLSHGHYGPLEEFGSSVGAGLGLEPAAAQSSLWSGLAKMTGVRDPRNFEDVFKSAVTETAKVRGVSPQQAIADFWEGKAPLYGIGGAALTVEMLDQEVPGA